MMLALPVLLAALTAAPAPLSVDQKVSAPSALLGEPFTLTVTFRHERDERYELSRPHELGAFDLVDDQRQRSDGPDGSTTTFLIELSAFELGSLTLPKFEFQVDKGEARGVFSPDPLTIDVKGTLPPDADEKGAGLYDIKPPMDVPVSTYRLLYALLAALAAFALVYFGYRYLQRPRPVEPLVAPPVAALHVRTFAALDELRQQDLPAQGRVREFYFRLSEILRGYLAARFGMDALECTSSELVDKVRALRSRLLPFDDFYRFVEDSDLAKFAKAPIDAGTCQRSLEFGYRLVEVTHAPELAASAVAGAPIPAQAQAQAQTTKPPPVAPASPHRPDGPDGQEGPPRAG